MSDNEIRPGEGNPAEILKLARQAELAEVRAWRQRELAHCPPLYRLDEIAVAPAGATAAEWAHVHQCSFCSALVERIQAERAPSALASLVARAAERLAALLQPVPLPSLGFAAARAVPAAEELRRTSPDGRLEVEVLPGVVSDHLTVLASSRDPGLELALVVFVLLPTEGGEPVVDFAVLTPDEQPGWFVAEVSLPAERLQALGGACRGVEAAPVELTQLDAAGRRALLNAVAETSDVVRAAAWQAWAERVLAGELGLPADFRAELAELTGNAGREPGA